MILGFPGQNATFTGRATITSADPTTGDEDNLMNYRLASNAVYTAVSTGTPSGIFIDIDRGDPLPTNSPTFILLSGFSVADYDYSDDTTLLSDIFVEMNTDSGYDSGSVTTLAQIQQSTPTPTYGAKAFGQAQIFANFSEAMTDRYIRIRLVTSSSTALVTIGNVWIGEGIDSVADGWNLDTRPEFGVVNRNRYTNLETGGQSGLQRKSIRTARGRIPASKQAYHLFMDMVEGRLSHLVDDPINPLAIAFDPDNDLRTATGQHFFAGLWRFQGNPAPRAIGAIDTEKFIPAIPFNVREHR